MEPVIVWLTRHAVTDQQKLDFTGWRQVQVTYRAESVHRLWLDVVLAAGTAPDVICGAVPWHWQGFWAKHVQRMSPRTIIIRAITEADNLTLTGRYMRCRHVYGKGLVFEDYQPPRMQYLNGRKAE